jgi:hypothetical protein
VNWRPLKDKNYKLMRIAHGFEKPDDDPDAKMEKVDQDGFDNLVSRVN